MRLATGRICALALAAAFACTSAGCHRAVPGAPPPHIVLITADTLRADHVGIYGYQRPTTPNIDRLADQAHLFADAVTVIPKTGPSFTTMFSGRYPAEHRVRANTVGIPKDLPLLAERLHAAGYRTAAFVSNPVVRAATGYGRGFDTYEFHGGPKAMRAVTASLRAWAERPWARPTFVWLHYIDPHGPYRPSPDYERLFLKESMARGDQRVALTPEAGRFKDPNKVLGAIPKYQRHGNEDRVAVYIARYDAEIRGMDAEVGIVLELLRQRSVFDESVIVFTSDHGESLGEHDFYFEHGWFAYEATLRVPLLIKTVGQTKPAVVTEQVSNLDLMPTLLSVAGVAADPEAAGQDILMPVTERRALLIENSDLYPDKYIGVRTARWKYLQRRSDGREELYDLSQDAAETTNLAAEGAPILAELRQIYQTGIAALAAEQPTTPGPENEEIRRQLRSLGYLN